MIRRKRRSDMVVKTMKVKTAKQMTVDLIAS
jgi:hypothetical protein